MIINDNKANDNHRTLYDIIRYNFNDNVTKVTGVSKTRRLHFPPPLSSFEPTFACLEITRIICLMPGTCVSCPVFNEHYRECTRRSLYSRLVLSFDSATKNRLVTERRRGVAKWHRGPSPLAHSIDPVAWRLRFFVGGYCMSEIFIT